MGYDTFGLFRGWCRKVPTCLEYVSSGEPSDAADLAGLRCSRCRCLPQEHVPAVADGYDPHSEEQLRERRRYDARLLPPDERAAHYKALADAAFKERNYRTAYLEYSRAIEATPDSHVLLGNRCQTYLNVGKVSEALLDAERCVNLNPEWPKGQFRHGVCLQRAERHEEAVAAFERAADLEPSNGAVLKALREAKARLGEWSGLQTKLAKARKRTTIRQAADMKAEAEYNAKVEAKKAGKIREITEWGGDLQAEWERNYSEEIATHLPAGVDYALKYKPADDDEAQPRITEVASRDYGEGDDEDEEEVEATLEDNVEELDACLEDNRSRGSDDDDDSSSESSGSMCLEENLEGATLESNVAGWQSDSDSSYEVEEDEEEQREAALLDDSKFVPIGSELALPPRNYTLVHEDGRLHTKDDFEPMSFGMQRVHYESEPEPIWVQTKHVRWIQTTTDLTVIPHTVPAELCKGKELKVSFGARQLHVQAVRSREIFVAGETEHAIDPVQSTWTTDGKVVHITLVKQNLSLYNGSKGKEADTHWHRLFTTDQYTERGMIDANYADLPYETRRKNKMAELERKEKEKKTNDANHCPLCGKDIRFFCACREHDKDYERPLPEGWKRSELGFTDNYDKYSSDNAAQLKPRPPSPPRPYQGRVAPKYGLDGRKGSGEEEVAIKMLKDLNVPTP